jgi:predicted transcriptional regulator
MTANDTAEATGSVIAFRASADLMAKVDSVAAAEGISRSDVARRACLQDVARRGADTGRREQS